MDYYSAIRRNEVLTHAKKWMNLENIVLSERSQTQKPYTVSRHLYIMFRIGKSIDTDNILVVARG